jgi:hypothetical protein
MAAGIRQLRLLLQDAEPGMDLVRILVMKVALDAKVAHRESLEVKVIKHFFVVADGGDKHRGTLVLGKFFPAGLKFARKARTYLNSRLPSTIIYY